MKSHLEFLTNEADESEGIGHSGIEMYKDAPYAGVARECGQNSADAGITSPVKMSFEIIEIEQGDLPSFDKYLSTVQICLKKSQDKKDGKAIDFFKQADKVLKEKKIKILKISDYNTKGLTGPCEEGTVFHSLVKSSGVSDKDRETSGGSFGIGKNAAFAVSELQTVFYSSVYKDKSNKDQYIAQGRSVFISHSDKEDISRKATGYWGSDKFKAITNTEDVPEWMHRKEQGTSIFVIGFKDSENWQYQMAASILINFFAAIHASKIEFNIQNEIKINHSTLKSIFKNPKIQLAAKEKDIEDDLRFSSELYECLTSDEAVVRNIKIPELGNISIRILMREDFPKRLAIIRNGMFITDNLSHFGDKFARFPLYKEFVAIVEPQDDIGNTVIKNLENPRHDDLSSERISDPEKRKRYHNAMKNLTKQIRETISQETYTQPESQINLDELSEFFADESDRKSSSDPDAEDDPETIVYTVKAKPTKPKPSQPPIMEDEGEDDAAGGFENTENPIGPDPNPFPHPELGQRLGPVPNEEGEAKISYKLPLEVYDVRNLVIKTDNSAQRKIFFTSPSTCVAFVTVQAVGVNNNDNLSVIDAEGADPQNNGALIKVSAGKRASALLSFEEDYEGPIELIVERIVGGEK